MAIETPEPQDRAAEIAQPAPSVPAEKDSSPSLWVSFLAAVQFLTVLPPVIKRPFTASELGHATAFYPLVGLLLGGLLWAADSLLGWLFPLWVRSALVLVVWVAATGALHLDGFLDTCDGLLGGFTPERRLEIMRDERVGAYALAGGILLYLVKFTAIVSSVQRLPPLLLAPVLGRWGITLAIALFPYARSSGLGRQIKDHSGRKQALIAALITLPTILAFGSWRGGVAVILTALVVWLFAGYTLKRIPGLTGDIYGAVNELVETAVLLVYAVSPHL